MVNRHSRFPPFVVSVSLFKEKMTVTLADSHNRKQICRWQVCAGSWWNTVASSNGIQFGMYRTPTAWTMTALSFPVWHCP
jgi:hypothetical protein